MHAQPNGVRATPTITVEDEFFPEFASALARDRRFFLDRAEVSASADDRAESRRCADVAYKLLNDLHVGSELPIPEDEDERAYLRDFITSRMARAAVARRWASLARWAGAFEQLQRWPEDPAPAHWAEER